MVINMPANQSGVILLRFCVPVCYHINLSVLMCLWMTQCVRWPGDNLLPNTALSFGPDFMGTSRRSYGGKGLNGEGGINLARLGLSWAELQPALRFRGKLGEVEKIWEEQQLWNSILSYFQSKMATKETGFLYSDATSMQRLFHRLFSAGGRTPGENTWESARITFSDSIFCTGTYVLNSL